MKHQNGVRGDALRKVGRVVSSISAVLIVMIGLLTLLADNPSPAVDYAEAVPNY